MYFVIANYLCKICLSCANLSVLQGVLAKIDYFARSYKIGEWNERVLLYRSIFLASKESVADGSALIFNNNDFSDTFSYKPFSCMLIDYHIFIYKFYLFFFFFPFFQNMFWHESCWIRMYSLEETMAWIWWSMLSKFFDGSRGYWNLKDTIKWASRLLRSLVLSIQTTKSKKNIVNYENSWTSRVKTSN